MANATHALKVPATAASLKEIRAYFERRLAGIDPATAQMIILALDECCSNIVRHRAKTIGDGRITIDADVSPDKVVFRIGEFCSQEDLSRIVPRDLEDVRPGGLGTHFVNEIMDKVWYSPDPENPGVLTLVMEKSIRDGARSGQVDA